MLWWTLRRLRSKDTDTRAAAVEKLTGVRNPQTHLKLVALAGDSTWQVREAAIQALGTVDSTNPDVLSCLLRALVDDTPKVRVAAAQALRSEEVSVDAALGLLRIRIRECGWKRSG